MFVWFNTNTTACCLCIGLFACVCINIMVKVGAEDFNSIIETRSTCGSRHAKTLLQFDLDKPAGANKRQLASSDTALKSNTLP